MFFPRFSTRTLLALMGVAAAAFFVLGMAYQGYVWAAAASVVILATCVAAVVHAMLFALVWLLSQLPSLRGAPADIGSDPFAKQPYPLPMPSLAQRMGDVTPAPRSGSRQGADQDTATGHTLGEGSG
jgi:hypothetical protein